MKKFTTILMILVLLVSSSCYAPAEESIVEAESIEESVADTEDMEEGIAETESMEEGAKETESIAGDTAETASRGEGLAETEGIRVYDTDYIKTYKKTLNVMFGKKWKVLSTEEKYRDNIPGCPHVDTRPQQFTEWKIEYHDGDGMPRIFVFDNRGSLSYQIKYYVTDYIVEYYKENFFDVYIKDLPLAPSSYVIGFLADISTNRGDADNRERTEAADNYLKQLDTPEGAICLAKLTPANVFEMCPLYLAINVSFSEYTGNKQTFEINIMKQIRNMIDDMNRFTNYHLTAELKMGYQKIIDLYTGERDCRWTYIQGEQVYGVAGPFFEWAAFDGYKGMFW